MKNPCCRIVFFVVVMTGCFFAEAAEPLRVVSPDGDIAVQFSLKDADGVSGGLFWQVGYKDSVVVKDSQLGFTLKDGKVLNRNFKVLDVQRKSHDSTWRPVYGERSEIRDHYNQIEVTVKDDQNRRLQLTFRAYNEGVAFQTTFPNQQAVKELTIDSEDVQFCFADDHQAWAVYSAQGIYKKCPLSQIKKNCERPLIVEIEDDLTVAIAEAGLVDYARMRLKRDKSTPNTLISQLAGSASFKTPYSTPWRVLMIGKTAGELLENNYLLLNLSPPNKITDTSWIKPGKQMRDVTITKANGKAVVDFAAVGGLDYLEIDAGWYGDERDEASDATTVTPSRSRGGFTLDDLKEVVAYAKSKDVGVIVYVNRRHLEKQIDELLPLYKKWGIAGIKFGFVQVGSQQWTKWLHDSIAKCADYEMVVDVHDEYRPTGVERMLPNFLTAEGIRGNEARPTPEMDLTTCFARSLCGPADFTMCWHNEKLKMSWPHQMAAAVVYYSPLQTLYWYDQPRMFTGKEPYLEFFRALPTVWDDKKVIQGKIGEFITMARRSGDAWFVGTMNAVERRTLDIDLSFLTPGKTYTATIYSDPDPTTTEIKQVAYQTMEVTSDSVIPADMAANGGQAIYIVPLTATANRYFTANYK